MPPKLTKEQYQSLDEALYHPAPFANLLSGALEASDPEAAWAEFYADQAAPLGPGIKSEVERWRSWDRKRLPRTLAELKKLAAEEKPDPTASRGERI